MHNGRFKVRSKGDAQHLAKKIKDMERGLEYEALFMGNNNASVTIQWTERRNVFIVSTSGLGWTQRNEMTKPNLVDFIWRERKYINACLGNNRDYGSAIAGF